MERRNICGVDAAVAKSFRERAKGLIGLSALPPGEGLLIERCNLIHTLFMKFPIDVKFLDGTSKVVREYRGVPPWRWFVWGGWRARSVLETQAKT